MSEQSLEARLATKKKGFPGCDQMCRLPASRTRPSGARGGKVVFYHCVTGRWGHLLMLFGTMFSGKPKEGKSFSLLLVFPYL